MEPQSAAADVPLRLSKYERARVIGLRAQMLLQGAAPLLPQSNNMGDPIVTATTEVVGEVLPFSVARRSAAGVEFFIACVSDGVPARFDPALAPAAAATWRAPRPSEQAS